MLTRPLAPRGVAKGTLTLVYDVAVPKKPRLPKPKCCVSSSRCQRCPIRMLKEGTLPEGLTVKKRSLVVTAPPVGLVGAPATTKAEARAAVQVVLDAAARASAKQRKNARRAQKRSGKKDRLRPAA